MTARKFFSDLLKFSETYGQDIISKYERGLLTNREAELMVMDMYKNHLCGADVKIKDWYTSFYPDDEAGQEIDELITFREAYHAMQMGDDFYETTGNVDSIVRERIFERMSDVFNVTYDDIYNLWLA